MGEANASAKHPLTIHCFLVTELLNPSSLVRDGHGKLDRSGHSGGIKTGSRKRRDAAAGFVHPEWSGHGRHLNRELGPASPAVVPFRKWVENAIRVVLGCCGLKK